MVLNGGDVQPLLLQNGGGLLDLGQAVVGETDGPDLAALGQGDQLFRPLGGVHGVVNPVEVHVIGAQQPGAGLIQGGDGVLRIGVGALGGELVGDEHAVPGIVL